MQLLPLIGLIICVSFVECNKFFPQEEQMKCASDDAVTNYTYNISSNKPEDIKSVYWYFTPAALGSKRIPISYRTANEPFTPLPQGARFNDRLEEVENSINLKIKNLTKGDTGKYDVQITIENVGEFKSYDFPSASYSLVVNDPCIKMETKASGSTLTCLSSTDNPQYSWQGDSVAAVTTKSVSVQPAASSDFTCCVDAGQTQCYTVNVPAAEKDEGGNGSSDNTGAIIGGVIGGVVVVLLVGVLGMYCKGRRRGSNLSEETGHRQGGQTEGPLLEKKGEAGDSKNGNV